MSWPSTKLSDICERVSVGHVGKTSEHYTDESGIPFLRTQNVSSDGIKIKNVKYITSEFHEKLKKSTLSKGDLILSRVISSEINVGIVPEELDGANCANIILIRPNVKILDVRYLNHFLKSDIVQRKILKRKVGSAQSVVNTKIIKSWDIPLPPLPEQKKIADILDAADSLRQKDQQLIEHYNKLSQSLFLDMFGDPVTNPMGWERGTIRDLVSKVNYGTSSKAQEDGVYPYLRMNNISYDGYMDFTSLKHITLEEKDKEKYIVKKGDILFNRTNSKELVGKTGLITEDAEMAIAGYLIRVRTNSRANPYYIWRYLNSVHCKQVLQHMCKSIVGMANINAQELQNIKLLLPPVKLQDEFAERIKVIEEQKQQAKRSLNKSEELFNSLLQKAFKGELTN